MPCYLIRPCYHSDFNESDAFMLHFMAILADDIRNQKWLINVTFLDPGSQRWFFFPQCFTRGLVFAFLGGY